MAERIPRLLPVLLLADYPSLRATEGRAAIHSNHRKILDCFVIIFLAMTAILFAPPTHAQDITTGLVGHWKLDETAGITAVDSSGNGNNGTMAGGLNASTNSVDGKIRTALNFNTGEEISIPHDADHNASTLTLSAWIKYTYTANFKRVITKGTGSTGYILEIDLSNRLCLSFIGISSHCSTSGTLPENEWIHVAATLNNNAPEIRFFVNGQLEDIITPVAPLTYNNTSLSIGTTSMFALDGAMDDVRVYDRALSAADILALATTFPEQRPCNAAYEAVMWYNNIENVMQYCNGTNWIDMGPRGKACASASCGGQAYERLVFLNFPAGRGNMGGIAGADTICNTAASNAGLSGTYMAWLADSDPNSAPATRFTEQSSVPYVTPDGVHIADNWTDLTDGTLDNGINKLADGTTPPYADAFTNVLADGTQQSAAATEHCSDWSSLAGSPHSGRPGFGASSIWTDRINVSCASVFAIMCFEQGPPAPAPNTCSNPDGVRGEVDYNNDESQMQYCNGADWISIGPKVEGASVTPSAPSSGLVAHWTMDDTNTTTLDNAGSNDGNMQNGLSGATNSVAGQVGNALDFDGVDDFVQVPNFLGSETGLTFAGWFNTDDWSNGGQGFTVMMHETRSIGSSSIASLEYSNGSSTLRFVVRNASNTAAAAGATSPPINQWVHVAGTYDGANIRFYLNGALQDTTPLTGLLYDDTNSLTLGVKWEFGTWPVGADNWPYDGQMDDVRVYNRALTPTEVSDLFTAGGGATAPADCSGLGDAHYNDVISGNCYFRVDTPADWTTAQSNCSGDGAYLVTYASADEENKVDGGLNITGSSASFWIGASDIAVDGEWRWAGGELNGQMFWLGNGSGSVQNGLYNNWNTTPVQEPNNVGAAEHCASMGQALGYNWNDRPCSSTYRYICEVSGGGLGSCSNPDGIAGELIYNANNNVMQYCNGAAWIGIR